MHTNRWIIGGLAALALTGAACGGAAHDSTATRSTKQATAPSTEAPVTTAAPKPKPTAPPTTAAPAPPPTPAEPPQTGQARQAAQQYLETMPFSRTGLIKQLEFDHYPADAAAVAVDSLGTDYAAQAVKAAQQYLDTMPFSHQSLVEQLVFDGYSQADAAHGATVALG